MVEAAYCVWELTAAVSGVTVGAAPAAVGAGSPSHPPYPPCRPPPPLAPAHSAMHSGLVSAEVAASVDPTGAGASAHPGGGTEADAHSSGAAAYGNFLLFTKQTFVLQEGIGLVV